MPIIQISKYQILNKTDNKIITKEINEMLNLKIVYINNIFI